MFAGSYADASGKPICNEKQEKRGCKHARKNCRTEWEDGERCHRTPDGGVDCVPTGGHARTVCDHYCACPGRKPSLMVSEGQVVMEWTDQDEALFTEAR